MEEKIFVLTIDLIEDRISTELIQGWKVKYIIACGNISVVIVLERKRPV